MKWSEMKRLAEANGFRYVTSRGKHDEYFNAETGVTILLERHWSQEVRTGLMNNLLRKIRK